MDTFKKRADAYGVGVRAGALTPQPKDEEQFREEAGLPEMSEDVIAAWDKDGKVRRPITLQVGGEPVPASQEAIDGGDDQDQGGDGSK